MSIQTFNGHANTMIYVGFRLKLLNVCIAPYPDANPKNTCSWHLLSRCNGMILNEHEGGGETGDWKMFAGKKTFH